MNGADLAVLGMRPAGPGTPATLPVTPKVCTPMGFLYGGSGLAACAVAAEMATGRPLVWITTQYVANAHPGDEVVFDVDVVVAGRATSQTHVHGRVGERTVLHATTAHTDRPAGELAWWGRAPDVSPPETSAPWAMTTAAGGLDGSFVTLMERRVPPETAASIDGGRLLMWVRIEGWPIGSAASQGFVADVVPAAVSLGLGRMPGGTSLDNTIRVVLAEPTDDWVLLEVEAEGFHHSIGHGRVRLWRRDGTLIGVGSQSAIIRTSHHDPSVGPLESPPIPGRRA